MSEQAWNIIIGLGIIGIVVIILAAVTSLAIYVLNSYSLYMILKSVDYDLAWLAWIPFCQYFAITMAFNRNNEPNINLFGLLQIPRPVAGFASLIGTALGRIIPFIGWVFPILALLINGVILCEMFDICDDKEPGTNMGLGIISSLIVFVQIYEFFKYMGKANRGELH